MGSFYNSMSKGRGSNKGKITPNSNNRSATISITVAADLRRMAEALAFLLEKGYTDAGSKSGLGRLCIEAVAMSGRKQGIPECETIEDALRYLRENGITWTREQDTTRIGNLLKFESAHLEGYGTGFDAGEYEDRGSFDQGFNPAPKTKEEIERGFRNYMRGKVPNPNNLDPKTTNTPSDPNMSDAELEARRKQKDELQKDRMDQSIRQAMSGLKPESNKTEENNND